MWRPFPLHVNVNEKSLLGIAKQKCGKLHARHVVLFVILPTYLAEQMCNVHTASFTEETSLFVVSQHL